MIVWGGIDLLFLDTGGKYTPSTDNWMPTTTMNAPTERELSTAVWTGTEMIIWGGYSYDGNDHYWNTGGRYNPGTDNWTATSTANAPTGRELHTAVWTGSAMIIWGGYYADPFGHDLNTGGNYDPEMDSWTATTTVGAPSERDSHTAAWTGSEMIVWGGPFFDASGGRYNPSTNTWIATSTANAPTGRAAPQAVWIGTEMIVWGGYFYDGTYHYLNTGGKYNPNANSWTAMSATNAPEARSSHSAIWTGNEMIVWGGEAGSDPGHYFNTGGRYNPSMDSWSTTSTVNVVDGRYYHTAVWTGNEMIVWGGTPYPSGYTSTGGIYCAQSGPTPTPTPCIGRCGPAPRPRPTPRSRPTPR
jgi:N-acetylneuraminic acid mutarotase